MLVIDHTNINICIKAASIAMSTVRAMKTFQKGKSQANGKLLLQNQKISHTFDCMNATVIHNNQESVSQRPPSLPITQLMRKRLKKLQKSFKKSKNCGKYH